MSTSKVPLRRRSRSSVMVLSVRAAGLYLRQLCIGIGLKSDNTISDLDGAAGCLGLTHICVGCDRKFLTRGGVRREGGNGLRNRGFFLAEARRHRGLRENCGSIKKTAP